MSSQTSNTNHKINLNKRRERTTSIDYNHKVTTMKETTQKQNKNWSLFSFACINKKEVSSFTCKLTTGCRGEIHFFFGRNWQSVVAMWNHCNACMTFGRIAWSLNLDELLIISIERDRSIYQYQSLHSLRKIKIKNKNIWHQVNHYSIDNETNLFSLHIQFSSRCVRCTMLNRKEKCKIMTKSKRNREIITMANERSIKLLT